MTATAPFQIDDMVQWDSARGRMVGRVEKIDGTQVLVRANHATNAVWLPANRVFPPSDRSALSLQGRDGHERAPMAPGSWGVR